MKKTTKNIMIVEVLTYSAAVVKDGVAKVGECIVCGSLGLWHNDITKTAALGVVAEGKISKTEAISLLDNNAYKVVQKADVTKYVEAIKKSKDIKLQQADEIAALKKELEQLKAAAKSTEPKQADEIAAESVAEDKSKGKK